MFNFNSSQVKVNLNNIKKIYNTVDNIVNNDSALLYTSELGVGSGLAITFIIVLVVVLVKYKQKKFKFLKIFRNISNKTNNNQNINTNLYQLNDLNHNITDMSINNEQPISSTFIKNDNDQNDGISNLFLFTSIKSEKTKINHNIEKKIVKNYKHVCHLCPFSTDSLTNLKTHAKLHTKCSSRQVKCQYCDFFVTNKSSLKSHEKLHLKEQK